MPSAPPVLPAQPPFPVGPGPVGPGPASGSPFAPPDPGYAATAAGWVSGIPAGGYAGYGVPSAGGYYGYPAPVAAPKTNGLAVASMVVSITGAVLLLCYGVGGLISIVGAILGHVSRRQIRDRNEGGDGMALAGIIVGWIATGLSLLIIAVIVVFFVILATTTPVEPGSPNFDQSDFIHLP